MAKDKEEKSWRDHGNSTWDCDKWKEFIELIKIDVTFVAASAYVEIAERTIRDWIDRDEKLSQEYERAKKYMDVITSNAITAAITDKDSTAQEKAKVSLEWKKRRDRRYSEKVDKTNKNIDIEVSKEQQEQIDALLDGNFDD